MVGVLTHLLTQGLFLPGLAASHPSFRSIYSFIMQLVSSHSMLQPWIHLIKFVR